MTKLSLELLPADIWVLLAKWFGDDLLGRRERAENLRNLRLTCRHLSLHPAINSTLFRCLLVEPTIACLIGNHPLDVSRIAPYARSLTFFTPPAYLLSLGSFEALLAPKTLFDSDHSKPGGCARREGFPGQHQLKDEDVTNAYSKHLTRSLPKDDDLLTALEARIHSVQSRVLEAMGDQPLCLNLRQRPHTIPKSDSDCFRDPFYDLEEPALDEKFICEDHQHYQDELIWKCGYATGRAGDRLVANIIAAIVKNNLKVESLQIQADLSGLLRFFDITDWDKLNLDGLKLLFFAPRIQGFDHGADSEEEDGTKHPRNSEERITSSIDDLISKSHDSLETLIIEDLVWPVQSAFTPMPNFRYYRSMANVINPTLFASWIAHWPRLADLEFEHTHVQHNNRKAWAHVFDAIRDHPMANDTAADGLNFSMMVTPRQRFHLDYGDTIRPGMFPQRRKSVDEADDFAWGIARHFARTVASEDNLALRKWLGEFASGDSSSDLTESDMDEWDEGSGSERDSQLDVEELRADALWVMGFNEDGWRIRSEEPDSTVEHGEADLHDEEDASSTEDVVVHVTEPSQSSVNAES